MLSFAQVAAILAFTGAVNATPVRRDEGSFSLHPLPGTGQVQNGLDELVKLRRRHGVDVHPNLEEAAKEHMHTLKARKITGNINGQTRPQDDWDTSYLYPLTIGDTTFRVTMATANPDFWVYSSLQNKTQLEGHNYYKVNPANQKVGSNITVGYAGASSDVFGMVYTEKVNLGDMTVKQVFGAAVRVSDNILGDRLQDGAIGLNNQKDYNDIMPELENTFIDNIMPQLTKKVFAVTMKHKGAIWDFGYLDQKKYTGPITWVDSVVEDGWPAYGLHGDGFSVGTCETKITPRKMNIHLDAGTSLTFTDPDIVKAFYGMIKGSKFDNDQQMFTVPCNSKAPDWTVSIGGVKFTTPGAQLISYPIDDANTVCLGGLQNIGGGVDFSLFGINWFKGKFIAHDLTNNDKVKLGFAKQPGYQK